MPRRVLRRSLKEAKHQHNTNTKQNTMAKNNANESVQSIKYSVAMMKNPVHPDEPEKAYANIQLNGIVSLGQLAQHIREHGSPYTRDVVLGVITAIVDHTREFLVQGYKVDLGDLGTFVPSLTSEGALPGTDSEGNPITALQAFNSDNIKDVKVNYGMTSIFSDLRKDAIFEKVTSRKAQKASLAAQLAGQESADWSEPDDGNDEP